MEGLSRPVGDIVTLLDLTPRDFQDGELFPLSAEKTWWLPSEHRIRPFSLSVQQFPFRGPTAFGQRFTFDIGSVKCGDVLMSTVLQIGLGHWFDDTTILRLQAGTYTYAPSEDPWAYANSLGTVILAQAELEIDGQTIETVDGDFLNVVSLLFADVNNQYGIAIDGLGRRPFSTQPPSSSPFPTESGTIFIPLPFFFQRVKLQEAFPLLAVKEGSVRIHVTFRPFEECVRRLSGRRPTTLDTPLGKTVNLLNGTTPITVNTSSTPPQFKNIQLITYAAHTDGEMRKRILRDSFDSLIRTAQTFTFSEPLKYIINKSTADTIQIQLPLEVNHPMEEILWFVRRKATANNNEWTNYSAIITPEYDPIYNPRMPLLKSARIQFNGIELIQADEIWFRQHISQAHKGGIAAFNSYIYGYSFANKPGDHQPSGTANASRLQTVRLTLDITPPGGSYELDWEIKVFVTRLEWLRFQNGLANRVFAD